MVLNKNKAQEATNTDSTIAYGYANGKLKQKTSRRKLESLVPEAMR